MLSKTVKWVWLIAMVVTLWLSGGSTVGNGHAIKQIASPHGYNVAGWELENFLDKWIHRAMHLFRSQDEDTKMMMVRDFIASTDRLRDEKKRILVVGKTSNPVLSSDTDNSELLRLENQLKQLTPYVEETIEAMVTEELKKAGVWTNLLGLKFFWPPVDLSLGEMPKLLVVSPRDKIVNIFDLLIDPQINIDKKRLLEEEIDSRSLSSLVVDIGGVATYPSLLDKDISLRSILRLAAHEWTHHYLFFHPLGRAYGRNSSMKTLNETVADVVGDEIGDAIYSRYYSKLVENPDSDAATRIVSSGQGTSFDFGAFMRETRIKVDSLLAKNDIDQAEWYMGQRRSLLEKHGYYIRKINQAYFAFYGSYAGRPASVNPLGEQVRSIRQQSSGLGEFLRKIAGYSTYKSFEKDYLLGVESSVEASQ